MADMELVIRRARPSDKRGVLEAVRTIWGGNDRIPDEFDRWVTHRTGPFFVAIASARVVGMGKLTVVSPTEAWLEGGRVAPRWRRRGIAKALIAHRLAYARERGFAVARFATGSDNTPIHRAARRFGFRRVAIFRRYAAPAASGALPTRARAAERASVLATLGPYVQFGGGWEWRALTSADVGAAIARGRAFISRGPAIAGAAVVRHGSRGTLPVISFGGSGAAASQLLVALRAEAARRGLDEVSLYAWNAPGARVARAAGFRQPWAGATYLYELRLRRRAGSALSPAPH